MSGGGRDDNSAFLDGLMREGDDSSCAEAFCCWFIEREREREVRRAEGKRKRKKNERKKERGVVCI